MTFKRAVFWSHLIVGVETGLVILLLSATGVLLTYERQIVAFAENQAVSAPAGRAPLEPDAVLAAALAHGAAPGHGVVFARDPAAPIRVLSGRRVAFLLDPYSGEVLQGPAERTKAFFATVTALHRWLAMSGEARATGRGITGAANLAFLFILASGAYLWWPRVWRWVAIRPKLLFRTSLPAGKARDYNWHHVFAAWAFLPLLAIVVSGVVISYSWAGALLQRVSGEAPPAARGATVAAPLVPGESVTAARLLAVAGAQIPEYRTLSLRIPAPDAATAELRVDTGNGAQFDRQTALTLSRADGSVLLRRGSAEAPPAQRARAFLRFLHTGEVYGGTGQTLAGLASMAAIFLVYTGLALAWRRLVRPLLLVPRRS
ncbi:PepSY-associated TM helix domain-containing protein [Falsiroseomonas sp.]|uniref:PepSY-associated TM helix domain-containing protein n=1 Tax=Falsiroseomonas sp. TaxID=2870721 RepID=UPI003563221F